MRIINAFFLLAINCLVFALAHFLTGVGASWIAPIVTLGVGAVIVATPFLRRKRSLKEGMVVVALFAAFAAMIVAIPRFDGQSPIGRFNKVYWSIGTGMSTAEVEAVVDREFPNTKPSIRRHRSGGFIGLGPVDPSYNAEYIQINTSGGRVVSKEYLPD